MSFPTNIRNVAVKKDFAFDNISESTSFRLPIYGSANEPTPNNGERGKMIFSQTSLTTGTVKYNQGGNAWLALGDLFGPSSSTNNAVARFDGTSGKIIQNSLVIVDDAGNVFAPGGITFGTGTYDAALTMVQNINTPFTTASGPFAAPVAFTPNNTVNIGNQTFINLPQLTGAFSVATFITLNPALPVEFRPTANRQVPFIVIDGGVNVAGTLYCSTAGVVTIGVGYGAAPGSFSGGTVGFASVTAVING